VRFGRSGGLAVAGGVVAIVVATAAPARAQTCMALRYDFQPDCYRDAGGGGCIRSVERLDLGPQIAVWLESADRTTFVDTLMVTNMTAARGIGNRPGIWNFLSGPLFPYGKRRMALPSILLLLAFVMGVFATAGFSLVLAVGEPQGSQEALVGGIIASVSGAVAATAAWAHWRRFQVPITIAAGAAAVVLRSA